MTHRPGVGAAGCDALHCQLHLEIDPEMDDELRQQGLTETKSATLGTIAFRCF